MVTVNINNEKIQIPERFTLEEWTKLQQWDFNNNNHWPRILEVVSEINYKVFEEAEEESLILFISFIITAMNRRDLVECGDLNSLTFGEFVDLDCFISLGIEKYIDKMLPILKVDTIWASEALWSIENFIKFRTSIYRKYKELFGLEDKDFEEWSESQEQPDPMSVSRGWYNIIVDLANGDILKIDSITAEPLEKVLTFLSIKKEKQLKEAANMRKIKNNTR
jgi:hypothetical protein